MLRTAVARAVHVPGQVVALARVEDYFRDRAREAEGALPLLLPAVRNLLPPAGLTAVRLCRGCGVIGGARTTQTLRPDAYGASRHRPSGRLLRRPSERSRTSRSRRWASSPLRA